MFSFKNFLIEVVRSSDRAINLLRYIHGRQDVADEGDPYQMRNLIPSAYERPQVSYNDFLYSRNIEKVPVKNIVSGQHLVSRKVIEGKINGTIKDHDPEIPYIIHHKGKHILIDGNHRVNKALLTGESHIEANVIHAPDDAPIFKY